MRRTDEAFKNEVLRRYRVQKQNRRNYLLLALSPLVLAIVLGSLLFLPQLSKLLSLQSPAGPVVADSTPTLFDIGKLEIDKIELKLSGETSIRTVTDTKAIETLIDRMAKMETKVTHKPSKQERAPTIVYFSSSEYETLTMHLWKEQDYLRIDAQPKGSDETVTTWYRTFNLEQRILHKAVYAAAGVTLANTDHWDSILTDPIVRFSSQRSGIVTDPALIADLTELLQCLQLVPFPEGGIVPCIQNEQITLTLQFGKVITCRIYGSNHISIVYPAEGLKTEMSTFVCNDLAILLNLLEDFKQSEQPPSPSDLLFSYLDRPLQRIDFGRLIEPYEPYSCDQSIEIDSILKVISRLSLAHSNRTIPEENYDAVIQLCFTDATFIYLYLDYDGYIAAYFYTTPGDLSVQRISHYKADKNELIALGQHLNFITDGGFSEGGQYLRFENFLATAHPTEMTIDLFVRPSQSYSAPDSAIDTFMKALQNLDRLPERHLQGSSTSLPRYNRITLKQGSETLYICYYSPSRDFSDYYSLQLSVCFEDAIPDCVDFRILSKNMAAFDELLQLLVEGNAPPVTEPVDPSVTPPDPPKPPESEDFPTTLEECLKQTIKEVHVTIGVVGKTPTYTYTDQESIRALLSLIAEQELVPSASQDFPDFPDGLHLAYWINDQGKEMSYFTILFDSSGKFKCSVYDGQTYHTTVYNLPVDTIAALTEDAKPYYDPPPSEKTPLIKDLSDNAVLQAFLEAVGVTVHETHQNVPQEIKTILTDYSNPALPNNGLFSCDQAYTSPDEISLFALLYNYHNGHRLTDAERVALVQAGVHPDVVEHIECGTFTEEEVRKLLTDYLAYMPAFADDLHGALIKAGFVYLPETGRFYHFHGDTNATGPAENIRVYHTDRADTVIALYSYYTSPTALAVVAFRNTAGGYKVLGYTPLNPF